MHSVSHHRGDLLLEISVRHLTLRIDVFLHGGHHWGKILLAKVSKVGSTSGSTVEADVPSELDRPVVSVSRQSSTEDSSELDKTLVRQGECFSCTESKGSTRILQVLGVGIVQGSNLTLGSAVFLQRIGKIGIL